MEDYQNGGMPVLLNLVFTPGADERFSRRPKSAGRVRDLIHIFADIGNRFRPECPNRSLQQADQEETEECN
jgi:hypothetical protein